MVNKVHRDVIEDILQERYLNIIRDGATIDSWLRIRNIGDGHYFYHTLLRFINTLPRENRNRQYLPDRYNQNQQKSSDVSLIRHALIYNYSDFNIPF